MNDPIISQDQIRAKARKEFESGVNIPCPFPADSAAAQTWDDEIMMLRAEGLAA